MLEYAAPQFIIKGALQKKPVKRKARLTELEIDEN